MHFENDFLQPQRSDTDWLGFDNGLRELPAGAEQPDIPTPVNPNFSDGQVNDFVSSFNPDLGPVREQNFMNYSLGVSFGNQKAFDNGNNLGYMFSATYKYTTEYFDDVIYGEYQRPGSPDDFELIRAYTQVGELSRESVLLGGQAGVAYKTNHSKFKLALIHLQNGVNQGGRFFIDDNGSAVGKSGYTADSYNVDYNQRSLSNALLSGDHYLGDQRWQISWRISPTISQQEDPDIRKTAFTLNSGRPAFEPGNGGNPSRIWRNLEELNLANKIDITRELTMFERDAKLKFGVSYLFKERDYEILFFDLQRFGAAPELNGDPNNVLIPQNIFPTGVYYYQTGNSDPNPNEYNSTVDNTAAYISGEFELTPEIKNSSWFKS